MSTQPVHVIENPESAAAMLHPLRLEILGELTEPDSATGLSRRLGIPRQKLNYHLRQLEEEGLVELVEERKKRNLTERIVRAVARSYVISPVTIGPLASDPAQVKDRASSAYLIAVASRLISELGTIRPAAEAEGKRVPTLTLQSDIRFATPEAQHSFAHELTETVAGLISKYHDENAPCGRSFRFLAGAYPAPKVHEENHS
jgi:DNA-binding transcriptional ArsR family regulator